MHKFIQSLIYFKKRRNMHKERITPEIIFAQYEVGEGKKKKKKMALVGCRKAMEAI